MKHTVFLVVTIFAIIAISFWIFKSEKTKLESQKKQIENLQKSNAELTNIIENIAVISKLQHYAEGHTLKNYTLHTIEGDTLKLKDLCKEKKLIYYFSEQGCQLCYLPFLKKLTDLYRRTGKENIIIIGKFKERRAFKLFLQDLNTEVKPHIYQSKKDFEIYPEYNDYAQIFQLTEDLVINNICITDKSNTKISDDYLKLIEQVFQVNCPMYN